MEKKKLAIIFGSILIVLLIASFPAWFSFVQNIFAPPLIQNYHCFGTVTHMERIEQKLPLIDREIVLVHYLITVNDSTQFRIYPQRTLKEEWDLVKEKIENKVPLHFYGFEERHSTSFFVEKIAANKRVILTQKRFE